MATKTEEPKLTQAEMVRRAMEAGKGKPSDGVQWIEETFGVTLKPNIFSAAKYQIEKKQQSGTQTGTGSRNNGLKQRQPSQPAVTYANPFPVDTELAESVKALVAKYGADEVIRMASLAKMFIG